MSKGINTADAGRRTPKVGAAERSAGRLSRRDMLKQTAMVGAVTAAPMAALAEPAHGPAAAQPTEALTPAQAAPMRESFETLTASESDTLEAIVARLIPTDENGPGATEARAAYYIGRALGGALASSREAYAAGLAAVDTYAQSSKGASFVNLSAKDQDAVLKDMETNIATGFAPNASTFFNLLRTHTIQGTFCDPYYGGNANFIGWDLIGYPGIRLRVTADEQRMGITLTPTHRSAYDSAMFSKSAATHDD